MDKRERLPKRLLIFWIACVLAYSVGSSIYISYQQVFVGYDPTVFVSGYHWVTFGVLLFFFLPLLCVIHCLAKESATNKLRKITAALLVWLIFLIVMFLFCLIFAYAAPEKFAEITL